VRDSKPYDPILILRNTIIGYSTSLIQPIGRLADPKLHHRDNPHPNSTGAINSED